MKLSKLIPARTKTLEADWCAKDWCVMSDVFRAMRRKSKNKMDKCYWCKTKFKNGEHISLAGFAIGNKVLCENCADELMK